MAASRGRRAQQGSRRGRPPRRAAGGGGPRRDLEGGLEVDALYLREDRALGVPGAMPFARGRARRVAPTPWDVRQLHATRTPP